MNDALDALGLLARFAALHSVAATGMGIHDFDGTWGSMAPLVVQPAWTGATAKRLDWSDSLPRASVPTIFVIEI